MKRILSGYRPTGMIHLGNYFGSLVNWIRLQSEYDCYFEVADYHALTTYYQHTDELPDYKVEMARDWLAAGLSHEKATIFIQSLVPEHAELHVLLSMLVPVPWLERNPTVKEMIRDMNLQDNITYGLLGYPVLQAADILIYKAECVPVGQDQLPHVELAREIAKRFNHLYGKTFPVPEPMLSQHPKVPGIDGRKMSKSLQNAIFIRDTYKDIKRKVYQAFTDPKKIRLGDPGHPEGCVVFAYHNLVNKDEIDQIEADCKSGKLGCVECKKRCAHAIYEFLIPVRENLQNFTPERTKEILVEGSKRARKIAQATLEEVKEKMHLK
ncbi:tryptophan--tRNA ligase [candidate division bacterium WOR-3 4484_18]|uniref:Tryptophan--tRNA ligase n=1 Tax=candidate division WOR-3 bacterium 4484_18 TaxID=2020626 RepID=A0A257LVQ2_UNCW3|nr:MAG: tryptophan--tRNA ligase [candidate division bacterium WOR-3 4484_18]